MPSITKPPSLLQSMSTSAKVAKKTPTAKKPAKKAATKKAEASVKDTDSSAEKKERKRREVNKETVDGDFSKLQDRIEAEIVRLRESTEKVRGIKFLRSINKALKTLHSDTKRVMKLKKKNNRKKTVVSGFLRPIMITPELASFTGWDKDGTYSRVAVTKFICDYIKDNRLYNTDDKRLILCDERLKGLLKYDPSNLPLDKEGKPALLNYFRLQKYLKPHFIKIETPKTEKTEESKDAKPDEKPVAKKAPAKKAAAPAKKVVTPVKKVTLEEEADDVEDEEVDA